jgi:tellurium resistance protein TerD
VFLKEETATISYYKKLGEEKMINLVKGEGINLSKTASEALNNLRVSIGWEPNQYNTGGSFDLDISIFALEVFPEVQGDFLLASSADFCFYNTPKDANGKQFAANGALVYSGDNRTGIGQSVDGDEYIDVDLSKTRQGIVNYSIIVSISDPNSNGHHFGMIDSWVKVKNKANGEELASYKLNERFTDETAIQVGSLYLENNEWKFVALGQGYQAGLQEFINIYHYAGN